MLLHYPVCPVEGSDDHTRIREEAGKDPQENQGCSLRKPSLCSNKPARANRKNLEVSVNVGDSDEMWPLFINRKRFLSRGEARAESQSRELIAGRRLQPPALL